MFATLTFLPQLIQTPVATGYGFGASVTVTGVVILPMLVAMAVGGVISGPIHELVGFKTQLASGSAFLGIGTLGFALWGGTLWHIAVACGVFGLGLGLAYAAMTSVIVRAVAPAQTGVATGMNANVRNIGGAIGTAVVAALVTGTTQPGGFPTSAGYTNGFLLLAAAAAIATVLALLVPATRRRDAA